MFLPPRALEKKIHCLLEEDLGQGDITTSLLVPQGTTVEGKIIAREAGTIAGIEETSTFLASQGFQVEIMVSDGSQVKEGTAVLKITGNARMLLSMERTLLNILTRMSGIATKTHRLIEKMKRAGFKTRVACTRKVAPGFTFFDKKAVTVGGGDTHRLHLDDLVLIKDNHLAIAGGIGRALERAREAVSFSKKIEIEVSTVQEASEAARLGADVVMLDNFSPSQVVETMSLLKKSGFRNKVLIEASGGISEQNILQYAASGVDVISLGEITDSAEALDLSLEIDKIEPHE